MDTIFLIEEIQKYKAIPKTSGIYIIKNRVPKPIKRAIGEDLNSILYIGETKNLNRRLTNFKKATITPQKARNLHSAAHRYYSCKKMLKEYPIIGIAIEYKSTFMNKKEEADLLKKYFEKHGELPPLNYKNSID